MKCRIVITAAVGAIAAAVALAPTANADQFGYIQDLNNNGISIYDAGTAVSWGYTICNSLSYNNGESVIKNFYQITDSSVPDYRTAYIWVESAVENLCPWHDHRGTIYA